MIIFISDDMEADRITAIDPLYSFTTVILDQQ